MTNDQTKFCDPTLSGRRPRLRRGIMLIDVVMGAAVVGVVIVVLAAGLARYGRASARLAEQRQAIHLAEGVLSAMQSGSPVPQRAGAQVRVEALEAAQEIEGARWVRVEVVIGAREASLVGVVPSGVLGGEQ